jgi:phosphatidylinositol glycan class B
VFDNLSANWTLLVILGYGFLVRVSAIIAFPSIHHPDEVHQYLEQAHRLAFGYGLMPWEYQAGLRSYVLPYLISKIFEISEPLFGGPQGYIYSTEILLAGMSLIGVVAVYRMGLRTSCTHAVLVGVVAATWFELVYFSFRPLSEAISCDFLLVGLSLASLPPRELSWLRLAVTGLCMSISLMLRIHLYAGILFFAVWICRLNFRDRWVPMILGGFPPLILFGLADWIAWGSPFYSYVATVRINLIQGHASTFGTHSMFWYLQNFAVLWAGALPMMICLIVVRSRESILWLGVAFFIIASHSLIPHKEYRFVFPASACLVLVAAMGSADVIEKVRSYLQPKPSHYLVVVGAAIWIATSVSLAFTAGFVDN